LRSHQVYLTETDGTFVARSSVRLHGAGIYTASVPLELPGMSLQLRTNSAQGSPKLIPNLLTALLIAVTLGLLASGALLWRDSRLRARAERELRDQHAFRKAMEDSLFTGLRARDLDGRITYVNPAFCRMTGYTAEELVGRDPPMPYWVPDLVQDGRPRLDRVRGSDAMRLGYETEFVRRDGERFPVLIFEAPLIDERGRQTGWMGSILDVSEQRRVETLARVQQEKLQVNARMALLGEVASALSHELNQPLAAIASYATAGENLLAADRPNEAEGSAEPARAGAGASTGALRTALSRIRDQSERAGQVIRSVQAFMRRRHVDRAPVRFDALLASIEPLIQLQARRSACTLSWRADPDTIVLGDRTMLEQVMLNLTRNAIEAMEQSSSDRRVLEVEARREPPGGGAVAVEVRDRGAGVAPEVEPQLFNAFVTTKPEGLGIGLSLCRSVIEAHGGRLRYLPREGGGAVFRFELPAAEARS
ncbi:MAG: two-component system sensor histidine kinase NtrB, partial [Gammaproteobacteria bacterium]